MPRLIYVMGPSGAGKDAVIGYARERLADEPVIVAHRYVTRAHGEDHENYVALTDDEFRVRRSYGLFRFEWEAHGLRYGVGVEINFWLAAGLSVVISGSRAHFASAGVIPGILPVQIEASPAELRRRLVTRGREAGEEVEGRLARASAFRIAHPALVTIDNTGPLEVAGRQFLQLLRAA